MEFMFFNLPWLVSHGFVAAMEFRTFGLFWLDFQSWKFTSPFSTISLSMVISPLFCGQGYVSEEANVLNSD